MQSYTEALVQFSLNLEPGASVGIVGRNGSGKSTLLKLISGIYHPDSGSVKVSGRISALIELGAGFHPEFTGRENVFLGGIMYGLSLEEIENRFDSIVRYAELEEFIDDPVRTYSSGMYMRLGFSLAVHTDPDILLVDEVLAVGDAAFISRCQDTISDFKRRGKTLVLVTHDLNAVVRWCDKALWLDGGNIRRQGPPRQIIDEYLQSIEEEEKEKLASLNEAEKGSIGSNGSKDWNSPLLPHDTEEKRWGNGDVEITSVIMRGHQNQQQANSADEAKWLFHQDDELTIEVAYRINKPVSDLVFGIGIVRADGLEVHGINTELDQISAPVPDANTSEFPLSGKYFYRIKRLALLENSYYLDVAAHTREGFPFDYHHRMHKFSVRSQKKYAGVFSPEHSWEFAPDYRISKKPESELKDK